MIKITISQSKKLFTLNIVGHSDKGQEPCSRVTSAFEMLANLMYKDRNELEQMDGYSLLTVQITEANAFQLSMASSYFKALQTHYPRTIKIDERT